jgi:hypothetical protein
MKTVSDIAQNKQKAEAAQLAEAKERKELGRKKLVPISALIFANIVFLSLDLRGLEAVYKITASYFLAVVTVIISGVAALYWWDFLYPHARRHKNSGQEKIAIAGTVIGIIVSGVLAFVDYIVIPAAQNSDWLWAMVVLLTVIQGIMLGAFWKIDGSIEAEAKREESLASRIDLQNTAEDFKAEIDNMETLLSKLEEIKKKFPGRGKAEIAARAMGFPVLAEMLADEDGDGIPNYKDKDYQRPPQQQFQQARQFANEAVDLPKATAGNKQNEQTR